MTTTFNPLTAPLPKEIPLTNAPLVRVLAQVRFPLIASIEREDFIAPLQEAIRKEYPVLRQERESGVVIGPGGISSQSKPVWRFQDVQKAWRLSLAPEFVALETRVYENRADFLNRLEMALTAVKEHIEPTLADRLGIRYVDRVAGPNIDDFKALVRPELAGILSSDLTQHVQHSISENLFTLPDGSGSLLARWARLPPRATVDPNAIEPLDVPSWILDVDAFATEELTFEVKDLMEKARLFAERIYTFFRWAVTEEFLRRYGGDV